MRDGALGGLLGGINGGADHNGAGMTQPQLGERTGVVREERQGKIWTFEETEPGAENMLRSGKALSV
jgi:hypothetical protein